MGRKSRSKGGRGEREAASAWEAAVGIPVHRSAQYCGRSDESDDVIGHDGVSIEVKRRETMSATELADAVQQCDDDAKEGNVPVVLHRQNRRPWLVTLKLSDLADLTENLRMMEYRIEK